jgi:hypothetical protein
MPRYLVSYTLTLDDYAMINAENTEAAKEKTEELVFETLTPSEYAHSEFVMEITDVTLIEDSQYKQQS